MNGLRTGTIEIRRESILRRAADFLILMKPRLVPMVLIATASGFYLASRAGLDLLLLFHTLLGTALATGGTLALNQVAEEELDAKMERTRTRPLPDGRIPRPDALAFGSITTVAGILYLVALVNPLSGLLTALTGAVYLFLYTPLKRITSLNSVVGAVPGALPPVIGWTAASGAVSLEAFVLFAIVFIWQIPHALAIAVLYRDDFAKAGIRLLPLEDPDGRSTGAQVIGHCLALLPAGMMPTLIGLAGSTYFFLSLALGLGFMGFGVAMARTPTTASARRLFYASLVYLPLVLLAMSLDRGGI